MTATRIQNGLADLSAAYIKYLAAGIAAIPGGVLYAWLSSQGRQYPEVLYGTLAFATTSGLIGWALAARRIRAHSRERIARLQALPLSEGGSEYRFRLLPSYRVPWRTIAFSFGIQGFAVIFLFFLGLLQTPVLELVRFRYSAIELIPTPLPDDHQPQQYPPQVVGLTEMVTIMKPLRLPASQSRPRAQDSSAPVLVIAANRLELVPPKFAIPEQRIKTDVFSSGIAAPLTITVASQSVKTGGFGDPNGIPGADKPDARLHATVTGSFDMPAGPGQSDGSGSAKGIKGTVASAGFGNGIATNGNGEGRSNSKGVTTGGFGSEQVEHQGPKIALADTGPATTPVEITFKPNPTYTEEARNLKLEGEVLLEISFSANGTVHVNRVVRGLGHGLDEAAVAAANKIRFNPALRFGQPTDSIAVVHVIFQLAY